VQVDPFGELLEVRGQRELLRGRPLDRRVRPLLPGRSLRLLLALRPADGDLAVLRLPLAAVPVEALDQVPVGRDVHERVPDAARELGGERLHRGYRDLDRLVREVEDAGVLDRVVLAAVRLVAALPEQPHHLDRLLQHLEPLVGRRPLVAQDVLVEVLARAHAEEEPARHQTRARRGRVGHDRWMDADHRARDAGPEAQPLGRLRDRADHAPHERAVALRVDPRVVVVGDEREAEPRLLRRPSVGRELGRSVLLGGQGVAELHGVRDTSSPRS
jgi:hypothetical protein